MAVGVAGRVQDRRRAAEVDAREGVLAAAARTASTATWTLPSVRFLKPTGIDRPEPSWRWTWLSVVRAPIAPQATVSEMYCGVIGSRNSQPIGSPSASTSSSSSRAVRRPVSTSPDPSRCGSLISPFQPVVVRGFSKYTRIATTGRRSARLALPPAGRRTRARRLRVVHAARPDDDEQAVVGALQDRVRVGAPAARRPRRAPVAAAAARSGRRASSATRPARCGGRERPMRAPRR